MSGFNLNKFMGVTPQGFIPPVGSSYLPYTTAYISAMNTAGVTLTTNQKTYINTFESSITPFITDFKAIYLVIGGTATAHKYNFINPLDTDAAFRLTFSTGWTHSATGMKPNGTSAYADSHLVPLLQLSLNSTSLGYYSGENLDGGVNIGVYYVTTGGNFCQLNIRNSNLTYYLVNHLSTATPSVSNTDSRGFFVANRTGATSVNGWKNGTKVYTGTTASSTLSTYKIYLGAQSNQNTAAAYSSQECRFAYIGTGLTDANAVTLRNAVQTLQTSLGRQV